MKVAVVLALLVSVCAPSPAVAQSKVADIYAEMGRNAARAAQERADIYAKMVADLAAAAAAIPVAPRVVYVAPPVAPVVAPVAPVSDWWTRNAPIPPSATASAAQQGYLEEALAYQKEVDNELRARAVVAQAGLVTTAVATCGVKPVRPVPPVGCRDLVAQCVVDSQGNAAWQWVCVK
jgi:hypothetical protein